MSFDRWLKDTSPERKELSLHTFINPCSSEVLVALATILHPPFQGLRIPPGRASHRAPRPLCISGFAAAGRAWHSSTGGTWDRLGTTVHDRPGQEWILHSIEQYRAERAGVTIVCQAQRPPAG